MNRLIYKFGGWLVPVVQKTQSAPMLAFGIKMCYELYRSRRSRAGSTLISVMCPALCFGGGHHDISTSQSR
jgi:hypothetical protein